jgi:hypothetical protein
MKRLVHSTFLVIIAAAVVTIYFVKAIKPSSIEAFLIFSTWLAIPHAIMASVLFLVYKRNVAPAFLCITSVLVSLGGILLLSDIIFWHPDAQGAIAVLMVPLLQFVAIAISAPKILRGIRNARST